MEKGIQISCAEVKHVLKHLTKVEQSKIPVTLRKFIIYNSDKEHNVDINKMTKRTHALLATIYRKYLSENKAELQLEHQIRLREEIAQYKEKNKRG